MKIRLREIKVIDLDSETVVLLTRFMRIARSQGADLMMQNPDIVRRVFSYGSKTDNPDLIVLIMRIRQHLINYVIKSKLKNPSFNMHTGAA